jgi:hypothetical protein
LQRDGFPDVSEEVRVTHAENEKEVTVLKKSYLTHKENYQDQGQDQEKKEEEETVEILTDMEAVAEEVEEAEEEIEISQEMTVVAEAVEAVDAAVEDLEEIRIWKEN